MNDTFTPTTSTLEQRVADSSELAADFNEAVDLIEEADSSIDVDSLPTLTYHPIEKAKKGEPKKQGQKAYFTFNGGNDNIALDKVDAVACQRFLGRPDAEEKIADFLVRPVSGRWIGDEAAELGYTLVQLITAAKLYKKSTARTITVAKDTDHERLASLLATLAPNETGAEVLARLNRWIEVSGEKAAIFFDDCARRKETKDHFGGRDEQGWVFIRKQSKTPRKQKVA
jgi:hypothetical protein